ncbi:substrate-binding domain-containing protein [Anaeromyxobacter oryzae]|uniref:Phosphate ABC transporter substrate-binding protein n=1 Tax=Anaeromyxobacter oryzae TaxID=2918170 RepID=A0ABM7X0U9_9BACT|nr:substrate-binding domain-containing protein [Anaeromyxobacter oryzae]BDG05370.1 phosphate ABC transporter substrate-binding protein [Anaeromyxobacter oryzae]
MRRLKLAAALIAVLSACTRPAPVEPAREEPLTYDGATTISNRILPDALPRFERATGHRFARVEHSGAGRGLEAMFAGRVTVAGVTRNLTEAEVARSPHVQIIGYDALGVFVHAASPVRGLTKAQLKALYTGKIRSWKEVGGADVPVTVCTERLGSGRATLDAVRTVALDGAAYGTVREMDDPADCLQLVARDPGAVTAATMAYAIPGTRALPLDGLSPTPDQVRSGHYLLSRPMLLVSREPPTGALKEFFEFMLSPEAQGIVAERFVPIR